MHRNKLFRVMTAVLSESREWVKVTSFECVAYLFSQWDRFRNDITSYTQKACSVVGSGSNEICMEYVFEANKVKK